MTQEEVNKWERANQEDITGWTIDYGEKKVITFTMTDKSKHGFEIEKPKDDFEVFYDNE